MVNGKWLSRKYFVTLHALRKTKEINNILLTHFLWRM